MKLIEQVSKIKGVPGMPLIGYPAVKLNNTTILDNLVDAQIQVDTLNSIYARFKPDMMMVFMDLSVEAQALGLDVKLYKDDTPEVKSHPIKETKDLENLSIPDPETDGRMKVFTDTIKEFKKKNPQVPIGGYCSSPFTLAGLLMGAENIALNSIMDKEFCEKTIDFATKSVIPYVKALEDAGADFVVPLDPTGVLLSPQLFEELVNPYIDRIAEAVSIPIVLHVCGQTTNLIETMCKIKIQGMSLDSMVKIEEVMDKIPKDKVMIGNISPVEIMLNLDTNGVYQKTYELLEKMKEYDNFVLSTGCDLAPQTKMENVDAFMRALKDFNEK